MAGQEVNPQPKGQFAPGKAYVVKGETLNKLMQQALPIRAGKGLKEHATPVGKIFSVNLKDVATDCSFGYVFEEDAATKLRGGVVSGGPDNIVVDDITLDLGSADGTYLWLKVDFTAITADDVLMPGIESIDSVTSNDGTLIPGNSLPTMSDPSGHIIIVLGRYQDGSFFPTGCGDKNISHCPGSVAQ
jgi:hypothetical protein